MKSGLHTLISCLHADISNAFNQILGHKGYFPDFHPYLKKLRGPVSSPHVKHLGTRVLRVIAAPDSGLRSSLEADQEGDVAVLWWCRARNYVGNAAGAATMGIVQVCVLMSGSRNHSVLQVVHISGSTC